MDFTFTSLKILRNDVLEILKNRETISLNPKPFTNDQYIDTLRSILSGFWYSPGIPFVQIGYCYDHQFSRLGNLFMIT